MMVLWKIDGSIDRKAEPPSFDFPKVQRDVGAKYPQERSSTSMGTPQQPTTQRSIFPVVRIVKKKENFRFQFLTRDVVVSAICFF